MKFNLKIFYSLRFKFILLIIGIAGVGLSFGVFGTQIVNKSVQNYQGIFEDQLPKLHVAQEVRIAVLDMVLYGDLTLEAIDFLDTDFTQVTQNREKFYESYTEAILHLDALSYGSESQAFKDLNGGESYARWKNHESTDRIVVSSPSPNLRKHLDEIRSQLINFENVIRNPRLVSSTDVSTTSNTEREREEYTVRQQDLTNFAVPTAQSLSKMEHLLWTQVQTQLDASNSDYATKQVMVILLSILAILIALFLVVVFSNRVIIFPLQTLTETSEEIARGKLSRRVKISSKDEIGRLSATFNKMTSRLQASYDNLEKIIQDKTNALAAVLSSIEEKNRDLEKSHQATMNLLEDIEDEKQAVEEKVKERTGDLLREKNKLLQVTQNMNGGGILLNENHDVVFINELALQSLLIPKTETNSKKILKSFFKYFSTKDMKSYFARCLDGETFKVPEIEGGGRLYEVFFHCIKNKEEDRHEPIAYFILFFDITDVKLLERSKSELVAVASHQLRTPLTAMRGNLEMLVDESYGPMNTEQHELLNDLEVSTIRLIKMVNEMLDITKIEKGDLEFTIETINVKESIDSVVKDLATYAKHHNFEIDTNGIDSALCIAGDKVRVRQIFQNLVDNAIKYSLHPGKLEIRTITRDSVVEIIFSDNGIGIPKNEQAKLFGRFYRASNTAKTASSGSGLGLYIVKSIAEQLKGNIEFESEEGKGTTFYVTFPIAIIN